MTSLLDVGQILKEDIYGERLSSAKRSQFFFALGFQLLLNKLKEFDFCVPSMCFVLLTAPPTYNPFTFYRPQEYGKNKYVL